MATIVENMQGRRLIKLSTNDIISIVREYQTLTNFSVNYAETRERLNNAEIYIPEDL